MTDVDEKIATHRGTRPGDPVGDILFNMLFRLILKDVRIELQQHPEAQWIGTPVDGEGVFNDGPIPSTAFAEIAFVDDVAYIVHSKSPELTIGLVQSILSAFKDAAAKRGLKVNFAEGKTEVLVNLVGPGSRASRTRLWHDMRGKVPVVSENETCDVQLVHHYKHLGSFVQEKAITTKDRNCRIAEARKAAGALVRPFFAKPFLKLTTKTTVFEALVSSKHRYNVHTWSWVSDDELAKWASGLKDLVRKLLGFTSEEVPWFYMSTEDLYALAGLDAPMDALHANRLRYVRRAVQVAPPILWKLLWQTTVPQSWMTRLVESFQWFGQHYPFLAADYPKDLQGWLTMVALDTGWKGRPLLSRAGNIECVWPKDANGRCLSLAHSVHWGLVPSNRLFRTRMSGRVVIAGVHLLPKGRWRCMPANYMGTSLRPSILCWMWIALRVASDTSPGNAIFGTFRHLPNALRVCCRALPRLQRKWLPWRISALESKLRH